MSTVVTFGNHIGKSNELTNEVVTSIFANRFLALQMVIPSLFEPILNAL